MSYRCIVLICIKILKKHNKETYARNGTHEKTFVEDNLNLYI